MIAYFETSAILSALFQETRGDEAAALLKRHRQKFSSILTEAECFNSLYKMHRKSNRKDRDLWLGTQKTELELLLGGMQFVDIHSDIRTLLKSDPKFSQTRTLDAIHLATAYYLKTQSGEDVAMVSFDGDINTAAEKLGFDCAL